MTAADGNKWEKENVIEQATNGKKEEKVSDGLQEQELDAKRKSDEIKEKERQQELPVRRQVLFSCLDGSSNWFFFFFVIS